MKTITSKIFMKTITLISARYEISSANYHEKYLNESQ